MYTLYIIAINDNNDNTDNLNATQQKPARSREGWPEDGWIFTHSVLMDMLAHILTI